MAESESLFAPLEQWSPGLFLVGAVLLVALATNTALATYTGNFNFVVGAIIGPTGFLLGLLGLLGLYPTLAERSPTGARVAAAVATVGALDWSVLILKNMGRTAGLLPEMGSLRAAGTAIAFLTMTLAYGLFAGASLRTGVFQRTVRGLILLESLNFLLLLVTVGSPLTIPFLTFEIVHVIVHGGIGVTLWRKGILSDHAEPVPDSAA